MRTKWYKSVRVEFWGETFFSFFFFQFPSTIVSCWNGITPILALSSEKALLGSTLVSVSAIMSFDLMLVVLIVPSEIQSLITKFLRRICLVRCWCFGSLAIAMHASLSSWIVIGSCILIPISWFSSMSRYLASFAASVSATSSASADESEMVSCLLDLQ